MGLDAVAPISPGHWPLPLASSLKRPGRVKPRFLRPQHGLGAPCGMSSSPYKSCSSARFVISPTEALSAPAGKVGLGGLVHQDKQ